MPRKQRGINFSKYSKGKSWMIGNQCLQSGPALRKSAFGTKAEPNRMLYVAKFEEAVYVLHVFEKRSRKTAKGDIQRAKSRYADLLKWRKEQQL